MDVGLSTQQKGPEGVNVATTLSAEQFYQHDPLLMLLKLFVVSVMQRAPRILHLTSTHNSLGGYHPCRKAVILGGSP
jgi:hypothetical protein